MRERGWTAWASSMWSEHCSYKSSKKWLKTLPTAGPQVIQGPGENAGVVAIGSGLAAIFKIESHNHPSFIEPYQGAATGVGGILRDVFTMGARPNVTTLQNPMYCRCLCRVHHICIYMHCVRISIYCNAMVYTVVQ